MTDIHFVERDVEAISEDGCFHMGVSTSILVRLAFNGHIWPSSVHEFRSKSAAWRMFAVINVRSLIYSDRGLRLVYMAI